MTPFHKKPCNLVQHSDTVLCHTCKSMFDAGDETEGCPHKTAESQLWNWPMIAAVSFAAFIWAFALVAAFSAG